MLFDPANLFIKYSGKLSCWLKKEIGKYRQKNNEREIFFFKTASVRCEAEAAEAAAQVCPLG